MLTPRGPKSGIGKFVPMFMPGAGIPVQQERSL